MSLKHFHNFTYSKEGKDSENKIIVLGESSTYLEGLKINDLAEPDKTSLLNLIAKFNEDLQPFIKKSFRRYLKEKIKNTPTVEDIFKKN
jgi:hypothetical protein